MLTDMPSNDQPVSPLYAIGPSTVMRSHAAQFIAWRLRALLSRLPRHKLRAKSTGRCLCILAGGLGDKLMALPAVRAVRSEFAHLEMTLLFIGGSPPFVSNEGDRILEAPRNHVATLLRNALRGYDMCFVNSVGVFDVWLELAAYLTGAGDLRGPRFPAMLPGQTVYTRSYVFGDGHETAVNLKGAGFPATTDRVEYLLQLPCESPGPREKWDVIFHPGSSQAGLVNRWALENFAFVANGLQGRGFRTLAIGAPVEKSLLDSLEVLATGSLAIRTDLTLEQLAVLLAQARLVIANDSGIGHLAAASGANLLTIMGANRPERVAPVGKNVRIIGPRCEYGGCYNNPMVPVCRLCINLTTPDEVLQSALEMLKS